MTMVQFLFYVMSFMALASALFVAATKNLVRSIFMFFITLLALAGLYVLAMADFVAITQVVIYVGGDPGVDPVCIHAFGKRKFELHRHAAK